MGRPDGPSGAECRCRQCYTRTIMDLAQAALDSNNHAMVRTALAGVYALQVQTMTQRQRKAARTRARPTARSAEHLYLYGRGASPASPCTAATSRHADGGHGRSASRPPANGQRRTRSLRSRWAGGADN